ncbi:MAG TPA: Hsp20/alpha crystallin family protein [Candidatus Polarisedimenticolaceae bacterium]|nr:Hsp20/alpha crystallin family protein [Candidatus Polarisedimenticolaceae bacterium]
MSQTFGSLLEVARIQSEINRLFDNLLDLDGDARAGGTWIPNVDILESPEALVLRVELPGVDLSDLTVSVEGGKVTVRGDKRVPEAPPEGGRARVAERTFGPFRRTVHLEVPVNTRRAEAVLQAGLLRITFPKVPNRRGEEVPIEVKTQ